MGQSGPTRHRHNACTMSEQHHIAEPMLRQRLYTIVLSPAPYLHTDRLPIPGGGGGHLEDTVCSLYMQIILQFMGPCGSAWALPPDAGQVSPTALSSSCPVKTAAGNHYCKIQQTRPHQKQRGA